MIKNRWETLEINGGRRKKRKKRLGRMRRGKRGGQIKD